MDKREQILEISKKLILKKGYSKVSVQDITAALGISKGSFYTYFKCKADMIHEMIDQKMRITEEKEKQSFAEAKTMEESLRLYLWNRFHKNIADLEVELVILSLFKNLDMIEEDIVKRLISFKKKHLQYWEVELKKYQKTLSFPVAERKEYADLIGKLIQGFTVSALFATEDDRFIIDDIQEVVERVEEGKVQK